MHSFSNIKELLSALSRERGLLSEMFKQRKTTDYKLEYALDVLEDNDSRIQYLIDHAVLRQNGNNLEIDDIYLQFFEQVLEASEEINPSYIHENLEAVQENIDYYFNEPRSKRRYGYLRKIKGILRRIGLICLRNVIDLKRNIDNTFKSEPNFKNKRRKLENLDKKRRNIGQLIHETEKLVRDDQLTFFKTATDEELKDIIIQLKKRLGKCSHNLIEAEKQIIGYLNKIEQNRLFIEKLRKIKYLKDQFTLESDTDIRKILTNRNAVLFEPHPGYPLKLSLDYLQTDAAYESIKKIADKVKSGKRLKQPVADTISAQYLETQVREEIQIDPEEVKNGFVAGGNNLFDFILNYQFEKEVPLEERVTLFCQMASQYETEFDITDQSSEKEDFDIALIYPK